MSFLHDRQPAILQLQDGTKFTGFSLGKAGVTQGEIVFNTAMMGYQEVMTDPSYAEQIITFTATHLGNVGINNIDFESKRVWASGIVVHHVTDIPSHFLAKMSLHDFLVQQEVVGIAGVDTRRLVAHIRSHGAQVAKIITGSELQSAKESVSTAKICQWSEGNIHVIVYDFGVKQNILKMLSDRGCRVTVVPAKYPVEKVLALQADGIVLSNGPGDPVQCLTEIKNIQKLMKLDIPIFGICLGHQLLALANGAKTFKMKFGHHGANHPVLNLKTRTVHITAQNHGYSVDPSTLPPYITPTFISLFDETLQGLRFTHKPFMSFQGHPEAGPGPNDVGFLFDEFIALCKVGMMTCLNEMTSVVS